MTRSRRLIYHRSKDYVRFVKFVVRRAKGRGEPRVDTAFLWSST